MKRTISLDGTQWRFVADLDKAEIFYIFLCGARDGEKGQGDPQSVVERFASDRVVVDRALDKYRTLTNDELRDILALPKSQQIFSAVYFRARPHFWLTFLPKLGQPDFLLTMTDPMAFLKEVQKFGVAKEPPKKTDTKKPETTEKYKAILDAPIFQIPRDFLRYGGSPMSDYYGYQVYRSNTFRDIEELLYQLERNSRYGSSGISSYELFSVMRQMNSVAANELTKTREEANKAIKQFNDLVAEQDATKKRLEQVTDLLRRQNEAKKTPDAKLANAPTEDKPWYWEAAMKMNPFANAVNDGIGQMEMLLRGVREPRVSFEDVILPDELRTKIVAVINQEANKARIFEEWGFGETIEKGRGMTMCFAGKPGTGKTMAAEGLAKRLGYLFWNVKSGNLDGMFVGDFEKAVTFMFRFAEWMKQNHAEWETARNKWFESLAIEIVKGKSSADVLTTYDVPEPPKGILILLDECDSIFPARDAQGPNGNFSLGPIKSGQINHILGEVEETEGVLILATNRTHTLDEALASRISLNETFPFPDRETRARILRHLVPEKCPLSEDVDFTALAKYQLAGRHLKNAVLNAARFAANEGATQLTHKQLADAMQEQAKSAGAGHDDHPVMQVINGDKRLRRIFGENGGRANNAMWN